MDRIMGDRQKKHEDKWAMDEDVRFKANARRNKLLGLWAAEKMGLSGDAAASYAKTVVSADFQEPGDEDVFRKVSQDFQAKAITVSEDEIRQKMRELIVTARDQIISGT